MLTQLRQQLLEIIAGNICDSTVHENHFRTWGSSCYSQSKEVESQNIRKATTKEDSKTLTGRESYSFAQ